MVSREIIADSIAFMKKRVDEVIFDAEHFFDGFRANADYAVECLKAAQDGGADWIVLCETNGGRFGTGNLDFPAVLRTLDEAGYAHFASVKIYRQADWDEAARTAITFLRENSLTG